MNFFNKIMRMNFFNKITISLHHSLDPCPELLASSRHCIPVKAAHHLLYLLHQRVSTV